METKTDEYDQILGLIATKIGISINDLKQQIPDNENLIFNEDGTLRNEEITLKDGTKVKIQADIVFYLYAACGNESLGLKLNEIKITKP
ncbi:hypothetical protein IJM86_05680 [bacterium]|nr:hypothetical protein [bacterium]